jgi:hypothetical protein
MSHISRTALTCRLPSIQLSCCNGCMAASSLLVYAPSLCCSCQPAFMPMDVWKTDGRHFSNSYQMQHVQRLLWALCTLLCCCATLPTPPHMYEKAPCVIADALHLCAGLPVTIWCPSICTRCCGPLTCLGQRDFNVAVTLTLSPK